MIVSMIQQSKNTNTRTAISDLYSSQYPSATPTPWDPKSSSVSEIFNTLGLEKITAL
jgi:hypothetical protein